MTPKIKKEIIQIDEKTYCISDYGLDNYYVAIGDEYAAIIDTGAGYGNIIDDIREITDLPLIVILTHGHMDHVGGMYAFDKAFMNPVDEEIAREHFSSIEMREWYAETRVPVRFPGEGHVEALLEITPDPEDVSDFFEYDPIREGDTIDLGNRLLEVYETPGHSPGHIVLLDRKHRLLFSGDTVNNSIIIFNKEGGNVEEQKTYNKSLNKIWSLSDHFDLLLVGHETPALPKSVVKDYLYLSDGLLNGEIEGEYEEEGIRKGKVVRKNDIEFWYECDQ